MQRAIHQGVTSGKILLEGIADGRPINEKAYLTKQPVYVSRFHTLNRFQYTDMLRTQFPAVTRELSFADFGFDMYETLAVSGFTDFSITVGSPLPAKISDLVGTGDLAVSTFDSRLLIEPSSGTWVGGPHANVAELLVGDLVVTGSNLISIAPITTRLRIARPATAAGTDAANPKAFGAGMMYLYVRNDADQEWMRVPFTGNMTPTQCVAAINSRVSTYIQNRRTLGGRRSPYCPNIFATTSGGLVRLSALGVSGADVPRLEVASAAYVVAQGDVAANVTLLGAGSAAGVVATGAVRGVVDHALIVEGAGTTLTVAAVNLPAGVAVGDIVYLSINESDLLVPITL